MIHREIFEHSPDCIFVTGVDDDGGFRLIDGNAAWEHLTGLDIARSRGHRLDEVVPAAYRGRLIERHHECLRRAGRFEYYGSMPAPGGQRRFHVTLTPVADAAGSFRRIIGVARDVTAVVAHRLSLLETALGQVREAVYLIDDQGRPHYVNEEACRMLGHERASLMGSAVWDIDPRWPPERWFRGWSELKALGRLEFETEHRRRDGRLVPVAVSASYVDYHGRGYELALVRDISERRQNEQTIRELQQLREAAREEERRHIARELHDEMGQHLSALRMEVSLLRMRSGGVDPALREKTADLQTMVDHMIQITRNLMSSLRPAVLDIGIASALEWLVEEFRGPSGVTCRLHVDEASVALDSGQTVMVFRIVQEALTNVARHARASRVDVTLERRGADYLLMVRDDGRGFDPETRPRRSLGLVGLQERAQMLGGRLDIRSTHGAGTTISVTFSTAGAALQSQH